MHHSRLSLPILFATALSACALHAAERPNVLVILADDLGWADLGFQGSPDIRSPNIDSLAAGGVRCTDAHTTASVCSPSRAGLVTGRYQQRFGHEANTPPREHGMDVRQQTIADDFKRIGYRTGIVGKWHLGDAEQFYPSQRGFDYFYGLREGSRSYFFDPSNNDKSTSFKRIEENGTQVTFDGYLTDVLGDQAIEFCKAKTDDPFFLFLSFTAPHGPMHATEEDLAIFEHIEDRKRRTYAAMIWAMDRAIGKLLSHLKSTGQYDNTLIWFLSDNGGATNNGSNNLPLAGHKGIKFEGGIRVPFLLHWPNGLNQARSKLAKPEQLCDYAPMVSALDILPTSLAAAGAAVERQLDGVNLLPYLERPDDKVPHRELFWHKLWFSAMRDGPWKLIYVQDYGYALYNLEKDQSETNNLAESMPERVESMSKQLDQWKAEMEEPRWGEAEVWFRTHSKNHIRIIEQNQNQ